MDRDGPRPCGPTIHFGCPRADAASPRSNQFLECRQEFKGMSGFGRVGSLIARLLYRSISEIQRLSGFADDVGHHGSAQFP